MSKELRLLFDGGENLGLEIDVFDPFIGLHEHFSEGSPVFEGDELLQFFEVLR